MACTYKQEQLASLLADPDSSADEIRQLKREVAAENAERVRFARHWSKI